MTMQTPSSPSKWDVRLLIMDKGRERGARRPMYGDTHQVSTYCALETCHVTDAHSNPVPTSSLMSHCLLGGVWVLATTDGPNPKHIYAHFPISICTAPVSQTVSNGLLLYSRSFYWGDEKVREAPQYKPATHNPQVYHVQP